VPDVQDLDYFIGVTIHNHIGRAHELAGSFRFSGSAQTREHRKSLDVVDDRLGDISCRSRIVFPYVLNSGYKLVSCFRRPPNLPHENSLSIRATTS